MHRRDAYRRELRALLVEERNPAWIGIAGTWLPLAALLAVVAQRPGPLVASLCVLGLGLMQYRLVMSCHEAVHRRLIFPAGLNEVVGVIHAAMVGVHFARYRAQHLAHHASPDLDRDPDAYIYRPILEAPPGWPRLRCLLLGVGPEVVEKLRQKGPGGATGARSAGSARYHGVAVIAAQVALLGLLTALAGPFAYPVFWLLPLLSVAVLLNRVRVFVEHGYRHVRDGRPPDALGAAPLETIDLESNRLERYVIAPYAFNHHAAHHRYPSMPWYNLARAQQLIEREEAAYLGRVDGTYVGLLRAMLRGDASLETGGEPSDA